MIWTIHDSSDGSIPAEQVYYLYGSIFGGMTEITKVR